MKKVWKVTVEDLTHLGGPMGSEYTTTIETKLFETRDAALSYVEPLVKGTKPHIHTGTQTVWDCGHRGYILSTDVIN